MLPNPSRLFVRRAFAPARSIVAACIAASAPSACSAPLDDNADGPPMFGGQAAGGSGATAPGSSSSAAGSIGAPSTSAPSASNGEQNPANGAPIAPGTNPNGSNTAGNATSPNGGAGGAGMVGGNEGGLGVAGANPGASGAGSVNPVTPPVSTAPDIACPANASFCSGFEGEGLPAGSQFEPSYLAANALGTEVELDDTVAHGGAQSLYLPAGSNFYRMLSVPVPANDFWIRLYTRSNVGFGAEGSTHAALFMGSIVAPGGDYNADRAVEIAEQFGQVLLNVKDSLFGTSGTNPNGQPGTRLPNDTWTCMEARFDGNTGNINVFVEGDEIIDASGWQAPMTFRSFRFGYLRFSSPERDVWMDDVVVASTRIGCQ